MVNAVTAGAAQGRITSSSAMLSSNFETFLALLTAQLRNQDPLSPVDSNEFTAQLTQMAGVEQQLLTNDLLSSLLAAQTGNGLGGASSYIGKEATAVWAATRFKDGQASWSYELAANAPNTELQVLDSAGRIVWQGAAPDTSEGVHDFTWDGTTTSGARAQDGSVYTLQVVAKNASGQSIDSQVLTRGRVTGVEMYDGQPYLTIGASILPLSSVIALSERTTESATEAEGNGLLSQIGGLASTFNPLKLLS
jgi:Flagellar hook capping protein